MNPLQPAVLRIWKSIGVQLQGLGVAGSAASDAGAALANYIFWSAAQFAAGPRRARNQAERKSYLDALATAWTEQARFLTRDTSCQAPAAQAVMLV